MDSLSSSSTSSTSLNSDVSWDEFLAGATVSLQRPKYETELQDLYKVHSQEFERKRAEILDVLSKISDKAFELEFQDLDDEMRDTLSQRWNIFERIKYLSYAAIDEETRIINILLKVWNKDCEKLLRKLDEMRERLPFLTMKHLLDNID